MLRAAACLGLVLGVSLGCKSSSNAPAGSEAKDAGGGGPRRIAVVSDIHFFPFLKEPPPTADAKARSDYEQRLLNNKAYAAVQGYLRAQPDITDVVINGDFVDSRSYPPEAMADQAKRIEIQVNAFKELETALSAPGRSKTIHFSIGNHDEFWDFSDKNNPVLGEAYTGRLVAALEAQTKVKVIKPTGGLPKSRRTAEYTIGAGGPTVWISHSPNASSPLICQQAMGALTTDLRAFKKMAQMAESEPDPTNVKDTRLWHVASDSHLPALDKARRIINTGGLSFPARPLQTPPTFAILQGDDASLMMIAENGQVASYDPSTQIAMSDPQLVAMMSEFRECAP